jgi:hypothetical protein
MLLKFENKRRENQESLSNHSVVSFWTIIYSKYKALAFHRGYIVELPEQSIYMPSRQAEFRQAEIALLSCRVTRLHQRRGLVNID